MNYTFGSLKGLLQTAKAMFSSYDDEGAQKHPERLEARAARASGPDRPQVHTVSHDELAELAERLRRLSHGNRPAGSSEA